MKQPLLAGLVLACLIAIAPCAHAQMGGMGGGSTGQNIDPGAGQGGPPGQSDGGDAAKPQAPPSATPSSKPTPAPAAAASPNEASLDPDAALFSAIARGDLTAARDAVARGADLNATNALGQKPIDASVDLGRNDITFMLLAERPLTAADTGAAWAPAAAGETPRLVAARRGAARTRALRQAADPAPAAAATGNTGTPEPAVGFLGF